jgi:hypothetical protein
MFDAAAIFGCGRRHMADEKLMRNCPQNLRLSKPTDMTIHWKCLEEHFLMAPSMESAFSEFFFSKKTSVLIQNYKLQMFIGP